MNRAVALAAIAWVGCRDAAVPPPPGPSVRIRIVWPGSTPDTLTTQVVIPLEAALAGTPGLAHVRSTVTIEGATIELTGPSADVVADAVRNTRASLPPGIGAPVVERLSPTAVPVLVAVTGDLEPGLSIRDRCGAGDDEVVIEVDPARLAASGRSLVEVLGALDAGPAGGMDALAAVTIGGGVRIADVAVIFRGPVADCHATLDGRDAILVTLERDGRAPLPPALRVLDGPAVHGELRVGPDEVEAAIEAARAAVAAPRWFATRFHPAQEYLTLSIGLAPGGRGADVVVAIDRAVAAAAIEPGRWRGHGVVTASAIIRGPDARAAGSRRAAALRAHPGVTSAGCDPCALRPSRQIHIHNTRLDAIGVSRDVFRRVVAVVQTGLVFDGDPPVRLSMPADTDLEALTLPTDVGPVLLGDLLKFVDGESSWANLRIDGAPAVELWARAARGTSAAALRRLLEAEPPAPRRR